MFLLWKPEDPGYERPAYRDWTKEEDEPKYSPEKELALLDKQILASDVFILVIFFRFIMSSINKFVKLRVCETTGF